MRGKRCARRLIDAPRNDNPRGSKPIARATARLPKNGPPTAIDFHFVESILGTVSGTAALSSRRGDMAEPACALEPFSRHTRRIDGPSLAFIASAEWCALRRARSVHLQGYQAYHDWSASNEVMVARESKHR